ncbi:hypothetical protein B0H11DRAFT_2222227 [Mycena galericulata]|nr:hypothetical protein B0H11DRAFT_2222227 [Mycena galericulata]
MPTGDFHVNSRVQNSTSYIHPSTLDTEANQERRRAGLPMDRYQDFDKPVLVVIWTKARISVDEAPVQVPVYPCEDMHIRLSDHKVAEVGVDGKETAVPNNPADEISKLEESGILPRITGPYGGLNSEEESFGSYYERMEQEPLRATWNQKLCQLRLSRDNIKHQNAHIVDPRDRLDANFPAIQAYSKSKSDYQDIFGRFVPDSENAAWFAKINPRIEQMLVARQTAANIERHDHPDMVEYFAAARAFENDFGHPFIAHDADDGLDKHFKRMAFQAATAAELQELGDAWTSKVISEPLTFTLKNPYPEGDQRRLDFDVKLRLFKRTLEGEAAVEELPSNVLADFPFSLRVTDLQSYYDAVYTQHKLFCKEIHHWEYFNDDIGEKRDGRGLTPFPPRPPLWCDDIYA